MTDAQIMLSVTVPVFLLLLGVIGFFLKGIYNRLDSFQTIDGCDKVVKSCGDKKVLEERLADKEEGYVHDKIGNLVDSFDSLCKCLKTYTKGECP